MHHHVSCDSCGKDVDLSYAMNEVGLTRPAGWVSVSITKDFPAVVKHHHFDICVECLNKVRKLILDERRGDL